MGSELQFVFKFEGKPFQTLCAEYVLSGYIQGVPGYFPVPVETGQRLGVYITVIMCLLCQAGEELSDMSLLLKDIDDSANAVKLATRKIKRRLPTRDTSTNPTPLVFGVDVSLSICVDRYN